VHAAHAAVPFPVIKTKLVRFESEKVVCLLVGSGVANVFTCSSYFYIRSSSVACWANKNALLMASFLYIELLVKLCSIIQLLHSFLHLNYTELE